MSLLVEAMLPGSKREVVLVDISTTAARRGT
jgi:hypothetical protein